MAHAPRRLIAAGFPVSQVRRPDSRMHQGSADQLVNYLRGLDGTDPKLLADPELLALMLPVVRADDRSMSDRDATAWEATGRAGVALHRFGGGHFFVEYQRAEVLRTVAAALAARR